MRAGGGGAAVGRARAGTPRGRALGSLRAFLTQLGWELRKLVARPRSYLAFAASLAFELLLVLLCRVPAVREHVAGELWRLHVTADAWSGLTIAVHVASDTMALVASPCVALVAADVVAKEAEEGTLRMTFSRPVARGSVLAQKIVACALYAAVLAIFVGLSSLALALVSAGAGKLVLVSIRESILGALDAPLALDRYALALAMLCASMTTVVLVALAISCCDVKPGTATVIAIALLLADELIRVEPAFAGVSPYCLGTRLLTWRQVFNATIPWPRIARNYGDLLRVDLGLIAIAWWTFRRRELTP